MSAVTVEKWLEIAAPFMEVVRIRSAATGDTYVSRKFATIEAADFTINEDTDAHENVSLSGGSPIDGTSNTVQINHSAGTNISGTLILFGNK